ncbi:MAG: OmpL47-type beta-barrel domain-containing protein [bacterium]
MNTWETSSFFLMVTCTPRRIPSEYSLPGLRHIDRPNLAAPLDSWIWPCNPNNGWYLSDGEITLTATDTGGSGVAETQYSLDGGETWNTYTSPLPVTTEGYTPIWARSWDNAGHEDWPRLFKEIKIDQTPPTVTETAIPSQIAEGIPARLRTHSQAQVQPTPY